MAKAKRNTAAPAKRARAAAAVPTVDVERTAAALLAREAALMERLKDVPRAAPLGLTRSRANSAKRK